MGYCRPRASIAGSLFTRMSGCEPSAVSAFCFFAKVVEHVLERSERHACRHLGSAQKERGVRAALMLHRHEHSDGSGRMAGVCISVTVVSPSVSFWPSVTSMSRFMTGRSGRCPATTVSQSGAPIRIRGL